MRQRRALGGGLAAALAVAIAIGVALMGGNQLPWFSFADPAQGYAGLPTAPSTFCDLLTTDEFNGGDWCLNGDKTMRSGSTDALGTGLMDGGISESYTLLPSGPAGSALSSIRTTAVGFQWGTYTDAGINQDNFTTCVWYVPGQGARWLLNRFANGATDVFRTESNVGYAQYAYIYGEDGGSANAVATGARAIVTGVPTLDCTTWDQSVGLKACTDGTCGAAVGSTLRPRQDTALPWCIGARGYCFSEPADTRILGAFYLSGTTLSAARIAALARAVLADTITGSKGEALVYTGPSVFLDDGDGGGSIVPANRPLIHRNAYEPHAAGKNYLAYWSATGTAPWATTSITIATPTLVCSDCCLAPDGTMTAERWQVPACPTLGQISNVYQSYTGTAAAFAGAAWVRAADGADAGTVSLALYDTTAGTAAVASCAFADNQSSSARWTRCGDPRYGSAALTKTFANTTHRFLMGCLNHSTYGGGDTGYADVCVWGATSEAGTVPTLGVPTGAAAVATSATSLTVNGSAWPIGTAGSLGATVNTIGGNSPGSFVNGVSGSFGARLEQYTAVTARLNNYNYTVSAAVTTATWTANTDYRMWGSWDGTTWTIGRDATTGATASALTPGAFSATTSLCLPPALGSYLCSSVIADPSPTRAKTP